MLLAILLVVEDPVRVYADASIFVFEKLPSEANNLCFTDEVKDVATLGSLLAPLIDILSLFVAFVFGNEGDT